MSGPSRSGLKPHQGEDTDRDHTFDARDQISLRLAATWRGPPTPSSATKPKARAKSLSVEFLNPIIETAKITTATITQGWEMLTTNPTRAAHPASGVAVIQRAMRVLIAWRPKLSKGTRPYLRTV